MFFMIGSITVMAAYYLIWDYMYGDPDLDDDYFDRRSSSTLTPMIMETLDIRLTVDELKFLIASIRRGSFGEEGMSIEHLALLEYFEEFVDQHSK